MSSKVFLLICLSMAFAALIISDVVAARELADTSAESLNNEVDSAKGVEDSKHPRGGGYGGYPGGGYGGYPGGGYGGYPGGGYGGRGGHGGRGGYGGGGHCRYGCCGRNHRGCSCCSYADEAVDAEQEIQP